MRAIVLDGHAVYQDSRPEPVPKPGEVVVRVLQAGVCETDLQLIKGYMGFRGVLGHEFVGVAESGPLKGQRVVGEINCACQTCDTCPGQNTCQTCDTCAGRTCLTCDTCNPHVNTCGPRCSG